MTNFSQVMRDWRRICDKMDKDYDIEACSHCPISQRGALKGYCEAIYTDWAANVDWDKVASIVEEWAAENPEPVYPTWVEWLMSESVIPTNYMAANSTDSEVRAGTFYVTRKAFAPIPADIAEKLGLEPKEGENNV